MPIVSSPNGVTGQYVFVGGVVGFGDLAKPANTASGRATGNLGLYMQGAGLDGATSNGTMAAIASGMANTGPGEAELNIQHANQAEGWFDVYWHSLFANYGLAPAEINLIMPFTLTSGVADPSLTDFEAYVDVARRFGVTSVAPIFSPNGTMFPLDSFSTNPFYAKIKTAALYGGGLTLDIPPQYFFMNTVAYQNFAYQEIQWAQQNHIRSTVIISPSGDDAFFLQNAKRLISSLVTNNATPTEWVVENYNVADPNGVGSELTANSIANVALYAAFSAPTSRPAGSLTVGALPGTVTAPSLGAGVTVTDTVHATGIAGPVYVAVMHPTGGVESYSSRPITLDGNGNATVTATLNTNGDYIRVTDSLTSPNFIARSNAVTIAQPSARITLSAPGSIQEVGPGAGITFNETITAANVAGHVDIEVFGRNGVLESGWQVVPIVNGSAVVSVFLARTGDYVLATDSETKPTVTTISAAVTITDPVRTITLSAPGAAKEASPGAGVNVLETVSVSNITGHVNLEVLTSSGSIETGWQVVPLTNGTGSMTLHLAHSGDYIRAADNQTTPTVTVNSSPVTISASSTTVSKTPSPTATQATSVQDPFNISSINLSGTSLAVAGSEPAGSTGTMREFLDGIYLGVVAPTLKNGEFSATIKDVAPGPHQLALTIDGDPKAAFYDFTRASTFTTPASAITTAPQPASSGAATALLAQLQQNHSLVLLAHA